MVLPGVLPVRPQLGGKLHQVGKPEALMEKLGVIVLPGGTVLDPFMGGATTGVAALRAELGFMA